MRFAIPSVLPSPRSVLAAAALTFPALLLFWVLGIEPYFPREFDDSDHWARTILLSREGWSLDLLHATYFNRGFRPILFPFFSVPVYLITHSVAITTQVVMPLFLSLSAWGIFRLLRLRMDFLAALLGCITVTLTPVVFAGGLNYLSELPFLAFFTHGLAEMLRTRRNVAWASLLFGLGACTRPVEAFYLGGLLFLYRIDSH